MANICSFEMCIRGDEKNIDSFLKAMQQDGDIWMGRGAEIYNAIQYNGFVHVSGSCKWSVISALVDNAISMRTEPDRWKDIQDAKEFITIPEACERWNLELEIFSNECGLCFCEHYTYSDGVWEEEDYDWQEVCEDDDEFVWAVETNCPYYDVESELFNYTLF